MRVPNRCGPSPARRSGALATFLVALAVAACSSSASSTKAPGAAALAETPSAAVATANAPATAIPAPVVSQTPAPSRSTLALLWQQGGPATPQSSTVASAIDPVSGNLWVAVPHESRYWIFSPDGDFLESWGERGSGPGQLDLGDHAQNPDGWGAIAFAPDGSFYVGDTGNHRVQAFDSDRHFVKAWGTFGTEDGQFVQITSVATDGKTVYVGDGERYDIQAFDRDGVFLRSFGSDGGFFLIALDRSGHVHATNPQNPVGGPFAMAVFAPDGGVLSRTDLEEAGGWPVAVTVDAGGNSYVSIELAHFPWTAIGIVEIDPAGQVTRTFDGGGDGLTVTPSGDAVYVTRGVQLDTTQWTKVRKYALVAP